MISFISLCWCTALKAAYEGHRRIVQRKLWKGQWVLLLVCVLMVTFFYSNIGNMWTINVLSSWVCLFIEQIGKNKKNWGTCLYQTQYDKKNIMLNSSLQHSCISQTMTSLSSKQWPMSHAFLFLFFCLCIYIKRGNFIKLTNKILHKH